MTPQAEVNIADIQVLDRQRIDMGDIPALAASIKAVGLIQPVVLNQDLRLIAGGRRLEAMKSLGWTKAPAVFRETFTEDQLQELELEENVRRKDITWQERCLAIAKIHSIRGRTDPHWGYRETGEMFGLSNAHAHNLVHVARALKTGNPKVVACANISDAIRVLLQEKEDAAMAEMSRRTAAIPSPAPAFKAEDPAQLNAPVEVMQFYDRVKQEVGISPLRHVRLGDCLTVLQDDLGEGTVDAFITDPPYAIDMDYLQQAAGGLLNIDRIEDTHVVSDNLTLLERFVPLAASRLRPTGFLVMWCDPMRFVWLHDLCANAGLRVQRWPLVWHKTSSCINQSAQYNFTKNFEFAIVARKPGAVMALNAPSSVIAASNAEKLDGHPFTKPPEVWTFIAKHICLQNSLIVDPFMGVGSSMVPLLDMGHRYIGIEVEPTHHAYALERFKQWHLKKNPDVKFV